MSQGLLFGPCRPLSSLFSHSSSSSISISTFKCTTISASLEPSNGGQLTAKERRQLRNERRESKFYNSKEQVEERLIKKPKKRYNSWTEELNLDNLSVLGPQWWVIRTSKASGQETAELLARGLVRTYPEIDFQVYCPAVHIKRKLKNGSYSDKANPLFPRCIFIRCILNKEIHDFIRDWDGVGGFLGSKVGNTKRQINKPKPLPVEKMEAIFIEAKEEQEAADQAFEEMQLLEGISDGEEKLTVDSNGGAGRRTGVDVKPKRRSRKASKASKGSPSKGEDDKLLCPGSSVRVMFGPFSEFSSYLKEVDHKTGKARVGFMLFGKESLVDLEVDQIVAETRRWKLGCP